MDGSIFRDLGRTLFWFWIFCIIGAGSLCFGAGYAVKSCGSSGYELRSPIHKRVDAGASKW